MLWDATMTACSQYGIQANRYNEKAAAGGKPAGGFVFAASPRGKNSRLRAGWTGYARSACLTGGALPELRACAAGRGAYKMPLVLLCVYSSVRRAAAPQPPAACRRADMARVRTLPGLPRGADVRRARRYSCGRAGACAREAPPPDGSLRTMPQEV